VRGLSRLLQFSDESARPPAASRLFVAPEHSISNCPKQVRQCTYFWQCTRRRILTDGGHDKSCDLLNFDVLSCLGVKVGIPNTVCVLSWPLLTYAFWTTSEAGVLDVT